MQSRFFSILALAAGLAFLGGCGGSAYDPGDGDGGSGTTYPLQAGFTALLQRGESTAFAISGSCTGSSVMTAAPAVTGSFLGVIAQAVVNTETDNYANCTPTPSTSNRNDFYNTSWAPLGATTDDSSLFSQVIPPVRVLPTLVAVGDTGVRDTIQLYADSSEGTTVGYIDRSYVIEPETSTTSIVNFVDREYDPRNVLLATTQSRYRITTTGTMTKLSVDIQYSTTSTVHLLYTRS